MIEDKTLGCNEPDSKEFINHPEIPLDADIMLRLKERESVVSAHAEIIDISDNSIDMDQGNEPVHN